MARLDVGYNYHNGAMITKRETAVARGPDSGCPILYTKLTQGRRRDATQAPNADHEIAHAHDLPGGSSWFLRYAPANSNRCANLGGKRGSTSKTQFQYFSTSRPSEGRIRLIS